MTKSSVPEIKHFFDHDTNTFSYIVIDPTTKLCAVIDSVMQFDYASGSTSFEQADQIIDYVRQEQLQVEWLIETHVHADHLSAAPYLQEHLGGKLGIGEHIVTVQKTFGKIFNEGTEFQRDGSQFDHLFKDDETYALGNIECRAIHTPGHTPACMTHLIGDAAFVGDTLFMPDAGTARCDFPGGSAEQLFDSIEKILALPTDTRIFMCHDYAPGDREIRFETSVMMERQHNIHVGQGHTKEDFVNMRKARDKTLDMPRLILPALQVNMRAGHLPEPEDNGSVYLKIPVNGFA
jgi:glyoxylase-like metal-dependent hydrolase (beta-lactamase superfamily II)